MFSGETEQTHPTEQEVLGWFKENFGLALFPTESRKEWVRRHWSESGTGDQHEELRLPMQTTDRGRRAEEGYPEDGWGDGKKPGVGRGRELLEKSCPDLVRYFEASPEGIYVTAGPGRSRSDARYDRSEIAELKKKVEELERLVYLLTLDKGLRRQNPPQIGQEPR